MTLFTASSDVVSNDNVDDKMAPMKPEEPPALKFDKGELRERLDPIAFQVTQEKGTER